MSKNNYNDFASVLERIKKEVAESTSGVTGQCV